MLDMMVYKRRKRCPVYIAVVNNVGVEKNWKLKIPDALESKTLALVIVFLEWATCLLNASKEKNIQERLKVFTWLVIPLTRKHTIKNTHLGQVRSCKLNTKIKRCLGAKYEWCRLSLICKSEKFKLQVVLLCITEGLVYS